MVLTAILSVTGYTESTCCASVCCGGVFIVIVVIALIYYINRKPSYSSDRRCPKCNGPIAKWSDECEWCGFKMSSSPDTVPPPPGHDDHHRSPSYESYSRERLGPSDKGGVRSSYEGSYEKRSRFGKISDGVGNLFKKKRVCSECGSELIYREEYRSWYCPNCHSYK